MIDWDWIYDYIAKVEEFASLYSITPNRSARYLKIFDDAVYTFIDYGNGKFDHQLEFSDMTISTNNYSGHPVMDRNG